MLYAARYVSPIGKMYLLADESALKGLWFEGQKHFPASFLPSPGRASLPGRASSPSRAGSPMPEDQFPIFKAVTEVLDAYFAGSAPQISHIPLAPEGSPFRQRVWKLLQEIPYGETVSYGELAAKLTAEEGRAASARAVGGAVGHNPISILIPCHRVIGAGGKLTGYAAGTEKKRWLLSLEAESCILNGNFPKGNLHKF